MSPEGESTSSATELRNGIIPKPPWRPNKKPGSLALRRIRTILRLTDLSTFERCQARNMTIAKSLPDAKEHLGRGHVCDMCRCKSVAGSGTYGDCYGINEETDEDTGHYGSGWCYGHEQGSRRQASRQFWIDHVRAQQNFGKALVNGTDMHSIEKAIEQRVSASREIEDQIQNAKDIISDLSDLRRSAEKEGEILTELKKISGLLEGGFDDESELMKMFRDIFLQESCVTETAGGKRIPISDKSRAELAFKYNALVTAMAAKHHDVEASRMIDRDDVARRIVLIYRLRHKYFSDAEIKEQYKMDLFSICGPLVPIT